MTPDQRPRAARFFTSWWNLLLIFLLMFIGAGFIPDTGRNPKAERISILFDYGGLLLIVAYVVSGFAFGFSPRVADSCCKHCGYSLTGNTSGVCPECGTPIHSELP